MVGLGGHLLVPVKVDLDCVLFILYSSRTLDYFTSCLDHCMNDFVEFDRHAALVTLGWTSTFKCN